MLINFSIGRHAAYDNFLKNWHICDSSILISEICL